MANEIMPKRAQTHLRDRQTPCQVTRRDGLPACARAAQRFFRGQGISDATILEFGLRLKFESHREKLMVPLHDLVHELVAYALVSDLKRCTYCFWSAESNTTPRVRKDLLYNANRLVAPLQDLIVVQDFKMVWWLWQHGVRNVVALMGNSCSLRQSYTIQSLVARRGRLQILCPDNRAGLRTALSVFAHLGEFRWIRWVRIPHKAVKNGTTTAICEILNQD
jgi:DNA primase